MSNKRLRGLLAGLVALLTALLMSPWAQAHPMPESRVWLDAQSDGVQLTLELPLNRLEFAFGQPLADAPAQVLPRHADAMRRYLLQHVAIRSHSGQAWAATAPMLAVRGNDGSAELEATWHLSVPAREDARHFSLYLDAITHEVKTHQVQVLLRTDWAAGLVTSAPLPLGTLDAQRTDLPVALPAAQPGGGFWPLLKDGALHILAGTDHLVFLFLLLWVAPLRNGGDRWDGPGPDRRGTWRRLVWLVSAFTVGHTVTLVLGSTGVLSAPAPVVETAVALSIALAALHVRRPLWRGAEPWMALVFGLVHGQAFSASLSGVGLGPLRHALALLAFNLGIELAQLLLVLAAVPALLAMARHSPLVYAVLSRVMAWVGVFLAVLWGLERSGLAPARQMPLPEPGLAAAPVCLALLWLMAGVLALRSTRTVRRARPTRPTNRARPAA